MTAPVLLRHPSSLEHDTGHHPEQAARIPAIEAALEKRGWLGFELRESPAASAEQLLRVHPEPYLDELQRVAARGGGMLDADTVMSEGSWRAAQHGAGGACALVDALLAEGAPAGFSLHRPPGHHALAGRAMGFCLLANAAIAARHALAHHGLERVLVLDWDVHHGNGTNDLLHDEPRALFVSIHEWPLYPGTGSGADVGSGAGEGFTINLPVPAGSGDARYLSLLEHVIAPIAVAYRPQLVLVSAGYDAHRDDPLAGCELTDAGYAGMTASLRRTCASLGGVPLGVILEGGYALAALASSAAATCEELVRPDPPPAPAVELDPLAGHARARFAPWWPVLADPA